MMPCAQPGIFRQATRCSGDEPGTVRSVGIALAQAADAPVDLPEYGGESEGNNRRATYAVSALAFMARRGIVRLLGHARA